MRPFAGNVFVASLMAALVSAAAAFFPGTIAAFAGLLVAGTILIMMQE